MNFVFKIKFYYFIILVLFLFIPQKTLAADSLVVTPPIIEKELFSDIADTKDMEISFRIENRSSDEKQLQLAAVSNSTDEFDLSQNISPGFQELNISANSSQIIKYNINFSNLSDAKTYIANIEVSEKNKHFKILVPIIITIKDNDKSLASNSNDTTASTIINKNIQTINLATELTNNSDVIKKYIITNKLFDKYENLLSDNKFIRSILPKNKESLTLNLKPQNKNFYILPQKVTLKTEITDEEKNVSNFSETFFYYNYTFSAIFLLMTILFYISIIKFFKVQKPLLMKISVIYVFLLIFIVVINQYWAKFGFVDADQKPVQVEAIVPVNLEIEEINNTVYVSTNGHGYYIIYDNGQIIERFAPIFHQENIIPEGVETYSIQTYL